MSYLRFVALALLAVAPVGCAFHASPAEGLNFAAPAGWHSSPGFLGFMQFWRPPNDDREVLMLFKSPARITAADLFSDARLHDTLHGAAIVRQEDVKICGSQPATFVEARGTSSRGGDVMVDAMVTSLVGSGYFAMYVRPLATPPNAMAMASPRELCAKP